MSEYDSPVVIPTPTQVLYPIKAVIRTVVQYLLGLASAWLITSVPLWDVIWASNSEVIVEVATNILIAALMALWAWIMSRPVVNGWLTKIGIGAQPKSAVDVVE